MRPENKLIKKGSVKDIYQVSDCDDSLAFCFSDRYSIFDWGEMPDLLNDKGRSLGQISEALYGLLSSHAFWSTFFGEDEVIKSASWVKDWKDRLCSEGLKTHFIKYEQQRFVVQKVKIPKVIFDEATGQWDYSQFQDRDKTLFHLIPLEVVFRHGLPQGSSFYKRAKNRDYLKAINCSQIPVAQKNYEFQEPLIEVSTKLETTDRYLTESDEMLSLSGMNSKDFERFKNLNRVCAQALKWLFSHLNIELWDGKLEWACRYDNDQNIELMLVDSIGPDELRISYEGTELSKELLRKYYKGSSWEKSLDEARSMALERKQENWKQVVIEDFKQSPCVLKSEFKKVIEEMYRVLAKEIQLLAKKFDSSLEFEDSFEKTKSLDKVCQEVKDQTFS